MRYVKLKNVPKAVDLSELDAAKVDIAEITDPEDRAQFIRDNAQKWSAIRGALWGLGGFKCWYSEAIVQQGQSHVEHYRPKGKVAGEQHSGYWWRAFDWTNYRISHPTSNFRITDYLTGKLAGKGTYFPLKDGSPRATCEADEQYEEPVLLDPTNPRDCRLLSFDLTSGKPIPTMSAEKDKWRNERAVVSIKLYHLDEGTWNVDRKDIMDEVTSLCGEIESFAAVLPDKRDEYEGALDELTEFLDHTAEFSSAALQVVRERGLIERLHPAPGDEQ